MKLIFEKPFHFGDKDFFLPARDFDRLAVGEDDGATFTADIFADMQKVHEE